MEIHFQEVQKETEGMMGFPDQVRFNAHNREEKSLGHATQNFWITTNRKCLLKSEFALFQTSSILFIFI